MSLNRETLERYRRDGYIVVEGLLDDVTRQRMKQVLADLIQQARGVATHDDVYPFGVILFIMMDIAKISLAQISRAVLPFYIPLFFTLIVITYWADFVLAVPRFFGKAG